MCGVVFSHFQREEPYLAESDLRPSVKSPRQFIYTVIDWDFLVESGPDYLFPLHLIMDRFLLQCQTPNCIEVYT